MVNLDTAADKAVHDAVDAFMEGRLTPEFAGEMVFETKHSRYRLLDGVIFAAPDDSLIGAELVGWLMETRRRSVVESAWQPGSRAVLVDRHRGRNIIVTSTTRLLHLEEHASRASAPPAFAPPPHAGAASGPTPRAPAPLFSSQQAPIRLATPIPPPVVVPPPVRPPPTAVQPPPVALKRPASIHLPPRPIAPRPSSPSPTSSPLPAAPLPPPRRDAPTPPQQFFHGGPAGGPTPQAPPEPAAGSAWELTSSEFELESENTRPEQAARNASGRGLAFVDPEDAPTDEMPGRPEAAAPIPLVRAIDLRPPRPRR